ncbi:PIN-LIKES 7-like protein [Drosera capensis]
MGFLSLLEVSSMPILEVLIVGGLGAYMATDRCGLLTLTARKSINKIVFMVFTPALMFANLAKTVTLEDIISWWFMPVNVGLTFLFGGVLGWIMVKLLKPEPYLEGLVIAICSELGKSCGDLNSCNVQPRRKPVPSSGSLSAPRTLICLFLHGGNAISSAYPTLLVSYICHPDQVTRSRSSERKEENTHQRNRIKQENEHTRIRVTTVMRARIMLGGFFIWTYSYQMVRISSLKYEALQIAGLAHKKANEDLNGSGITPLLKTGNEGSTTGPSEADTEGQYVLTEAKKETMLSKVMTLFQQILEELMAPPTLGAIIGLIFGAVKWLKMLIIGEDAPFRVIQDSIQLLGDGAIPCITLILGGNLVQGIRTARLKASVIIGVIVVKFILVPIIGVAVVLLAVRLGFLPQDPLYRFVLLIQYALPPATNISTMSEFFHVGQEECSVIYLWTYLFSVIALSSWSVLFLLIVS